MKKFIFQIKIILLPIVLLSVFLAPFQSAWASSPADVGPKPTMSFDFVGETSSPPAIVVGTLMECQDSTCKDAKSLRTLGPQHFSCTQTQCSSMAYGYSPYHKLVIQFEDGKTRQSNIFQKKYYDARYKVTVRADDLSVQELRGGNSFLNLILLLGGIGAVSIICLVMFVFIPFVVVLLVFWLRSRQGKGLFSDTPALYWIAWLLSVLLLVGVGLASPALIFTVVIEGILSWLYAWRRKVDKLRMVTVVTLANLLTLPVLILVLNQPRDLPSLVPLIVGELAVWLVETVILYFTQSQSLRFLEALGLSFGLNAASFMIGLFLPL